ncbi:MAG: ABC transporter permease [Actinobacteria bacterium]|nr:ABC transporter permease [Actinomycetota bacterium]
MNAVIDERADQIDPGHEGSIREAISDYRDKIRGGDLGSLPAILGLIAIVIIFGVMQGKTFLSAANFANLLTQSSMVMVLAMGLVFVLLLGEIDLSAGFAAGTCAAVLGVTLTMKGWPWYLAMVAALVTGALIGLLIGVLVARLGIPSFVVTLAMFLALQGLMLLIIGEGGTIRVSADTGGPILGIENNNMTIIGGWILFLVVVGGYALTTGLRLRKRLSQGLTTQAPSVWLLKVIGLAVIYGLFTWFLSQERSQRPDVTSIMGVPYIVPLIIVLLVFLTFVLGRTAFGRHIYAVGGNTEAARRAGISVQGIKIACFVICSTMAGVAGILFASRDNSVSPSTGGSTTLLYAVAAAVIGGTSLFGGRGRVLDAVLGGLVVAVIGNGLPLITQQAGIQFIVTGLVLLVAASVDALSRRRSASSGRA